jgi:hypothetical protein
VQPTGDRAAGQRGTDRPPDRDAGGQQPGALGLVEPGQRCRVAGGQRGGDGLVERLGAGIEVAGCLDAAPGRAVAHRQHPDVAR